MKKYRLPMWQAQVGLECAEIMEIMDLKKADLKVPDFDPIEHYPQELRHVKVKTGLFKSRVVSAKTMAIFTGPGWTLLDKYAKEVVGDLRKSQVLARILHMLMLALSHNMPVEININKDGYTATIVTSGFPPIPSPAELVRDAFFFVDGDIAEGIHESITTSGESIQILAD